MTEDATITRTGLKDKETNWHWNWRLTKNNQDDTGQTSICMTNFSRSLLELTVLFLHVAPPPSIYKSTCPWFFVLLVVGWGKAVGFWVGVCPPPQLLASKINFPFHQPGLFNGFWAASSQPHSRWQPHSGGSHQVSYCLYQGISSIVSTEAILHWWWACGLSFEESWYRCMRSEQLCSVWSSSFLSLYPRSRSLKLWVSDSILLLSNARQWGTWPRTVQYILRTLTFP